MIWKPPPLETTHKRTLDPKTLAELSNAPQDPLCLFTECSLTTRKEGSHIHYSQANKCRKHLAWVIHPRQHRQNIFYIVTPPNQKLHKNSEIVSEFKEYYASLYNLPDPSTTNALPNSTPLDLQQYIQDTALPRIPSPDVDSLEQPITSSDFLNAIKGLKNCKSPGPDGYTPWFYKTFAHQLARLWHEHFRR